MHTDTLDQAEQRLRRVLRLLDSGAALFFPKRPDRSGGALGDVPYELTSARQRLSLVLSDALRAPMLSRPAPPEGGSSSSGNATQEASAWPSELSPEDVRREIRALLPRVVDQLVTNLATASSKAELLSATAKATALWATISNYIGAYYQTQQDTNARAGDLKLVLDAGERLMNAMEERRAELSKLRVELKELRELIASRSGDVPWWLND